MGTISYSALREFARLWEATDLPAIEPIVAALARYDEIGAEVRALRAVGGGGLTDAASRVATGQISLAEGLRDFAAALSADEPVGRGSSSRRLDVLADTALSYVRRDAQQWLTENADGLAESVDNAFAAIDAEMRKLAPAIEGIASDLDAARAGGKVAKAWARSYELQNQKYALGAIKAYLVRLGLVREAVPA
jgi:hypothetical protein